MTSEQLEAAQKMQAEGLSTYRIALVLGLSRSAVRFRLEYKARGPKKHGPRQRHTVHFEPSNRPEVTPAAIEDRERRYGLQPRDLTAAFCGDPLPGYSALDTFVSVGDVASRLISKLEAQRRDNDQAA